MSVDARRPLRRGTIVALGATVILASCDTSLDTRRAELCRRALPALAAKDTVPEVQRVGRGSSRDIVRVDFRATGPSGTGMTSHWLLCRFEPDNDKLTAATTDGGPVTGASLYLLRHYYLGAPAGAGVDDRIR